jgi:hypothetical protein
MGGAVSDVLEGASDVVSDVGQGIVDVSQNLGLSGGGGILGQIEGGITDTVGNVSDALAEVDDAIPPEVKIAAAIYLASQGIPTGAEGAALSSAGATEAALTATDLAIGGGSLAGTAPIVGAGAGAATVGGYISDAEQIAAMNAGGGAAGTVGYVSDSQQIAQMANAGGTGASIPTTGGISSGGNMNLSDFSSALNIASSVNSLTGGGVSSLLGGPGSISGSEAQQMADPFAPYRANLGQMYSGALQPGTGIDITRMPGYSQYTSGVLNPAMEASKRSAAASGLLYSGRESAALQDIGQRGYYGFMTDYLNRLAQGSGATSNPAQAGGLGISQNMANQAAFSQGLGGLGQGIAGLYPGSSTNTMGNVPYNPSSIYSSFASPTSQYGYGVGSLLSGTSGIGD